MSKSIRSRFPFFLDRDISAKHPSERAHAADHDVLDNHRGLSKSALLGIAVLLVAVVALGSGYLGLKLGRQYQMNAECCQLSLFQSVLVSAKERLGLVRFYSQIGQDKWVSEKIFPGVKNGFFLDVGSGDGTFNSNTKALEQKGWSGICVDPFPKNMQDRTCQTFKEVVSSESGKKVKFSTGGQDNRDSFWGGITDTIGPAVRATIPTAPSVELSTVTLADILERANAPHFIQFMSLDIEGGELNALKGFPFDKYRIGALDVEHFWEEPKRSQIKALMESHGYKRVHTWYWDDFYVPANP